MINLPNLQQKMTNCKLTEMRTSIRLCCGDRGWIRVWLDITFSQQVNLPPVHASLQDLCLHQQMCTPDKKTQGLSTTQINNALTFIQSLASRTWTRPLVLKIGTEEIMAKAYPNSSPTKYLEDIQAYLYARTHTNFRPPPLKHRW